MPSTRGRCGCRTLPSLARPQTPRRLIDRVFACRRLACRVGQRPTTCGVRAARARLLASMWVEDVDEGGPVVRVSWARRSPSRSAGAERAAGRAVDEQVVGGDIEGLDELDHDVDRGLILPVSCD